MKLSSCLLTGLCAMVFLTAAGGCASSGGGRCSFWIDLYDGEPVPYEDVFDDIQEARIIYIGETHTLERHHEMQERIVTDLAAKGIPLVLAVEQMEHNYQEAFDRYAAGDISFDQLAEDTNWAKRWSNYEQYRGVFEAARRGGARMVALNARAETIRKVGKQGLDGLDEATRAELPPDIDLDDPMYEQRLKVVMMIHAMVPEERMRKMFEAQVSRDEVMAHRLAEFMKSDYGKGRTAVVLCGSGHVSHGLGTPARVRRRMPDARDRILILTNSGDLELSPKMRAMMRDITITHEQLRHLDKPYADYLHARSPKP